MERIPPARLRQDEIPHDRARGLRRPQYLFARDNGGKRFRLLRDRKRYGKWGRLRRSASLREGRGFSDRTSASASLWKDIASSVSTTSSPETPRIFRTSDRKSVV